MAGASGSGNSTGAERLLTSVARQSFSVSAKPLSPAAGAASSSASAEGDGRA